MSHAWQDIKTAQFPIQNVGMIPWALAEQAYAVYVKRHGGSQSLQRLAERGGFGLAELGFLLRGYEQRHDRDPRDYQQACEFAARAIVTALTPPAPPSAGAQEPTLMMQKHITAWIHAWVSEEWALREFSAVNTDEGRAIKAAARHIADYLALRLARAQETTHEEEKAEGTPGATEPARLSMRSEP